MSNPEISIEVTDLVKDFRVYHRAYASLKAQIFSWFKSMTRGKTSHYELHRVLDGVSFSIPTGQAVALIGRNGAGKSTLLAILSRIYLPTSGEAVLQGDLMSMLQLGAGFHGELTAIENVYFYGAIHGLSDEIIKQRYASILEFSELDQASMDLPVRMFSSGMILRLAFSLAVHLDANIILLDEGLAVGDEWFQEKCFLKIEEMKKQGRTLMIVSHELDHVERLADRVIWLDGGKIRADGDVPTTLALYREEMQHRAGG